ncbi:MAG: MSCRAMM family protein [Isosphaeraceae bacterium]
MYKAAIRRRDPNEPPWQPGPIPATIPVHVFGVARDEDGKLVAGATVTLYTITDKGSKPAGAATTDREGRYEIRDAVLPVITSFGGHVLPQEITPYSSFLLCGLSPGYGITWSPPQSMYALAEPNPDDIQGHLPLNQPVALDLTFPKAAGLRGKVVDETGRPIEGAKLQVWDCVLLDDTGHETNNRQGYDWKSLPGNLGRAVTASDGRFQIEGLADRACYGISATRPERDGTRLSFFAATIPGPDTVHEQSQPHFFNGRLRHEVRTNSITITLPKSRPIAVTVVGDDNGKPIAGAQVFSFNGIGAVGFSSGGTTDSSGNTLLRLPPGRYAAIASDPPIETHYIRYQRGPLIVEPGEGAQHLEIRQKAGCELIFEAVAFGTDKPMAEVFFWKASEDKPDDTQNIEPSTFKGGEPWTDAKGQLRAVLPPEPGKCYRFRFAGVHEPNMPPGMSPGMANKQGYEAFPTQSVPVELVGGKTIRLRFVLRKTGL